MAVERLLWLEKHEKVICVQIKKPIKRFYISRRVLWSGSLLYKKKFENLCGSIWNIPMTRRASEGLDEEWCFVSSRT